MNILELKHSRSLTEKEYGKVIKEHFIIQYVLNRASISLNTNSVEEAIDAWNIINEELKLI